MPNLPVSVGLHVTLHVQEALQTMSPRQQQQQQSAGASLEVQVSILQSELMASQQQVAELSARLAAAEGTRAALQEQLDHLGVKVGTLQVTVSPLSLQCCAPGADCK